MSKESSFDIVSKIEMPEVTNAVNLALKEIQTRYDFKGSKSNITVEKDGLVLVSDDDYKLSQLKDVLISKLVKRGIPIKNLEYGKLENASGGTVRQHASIKQGIDRDDAKKINNIIKDLKLKVKSQIQEDQIRVTGKNRDDLQAVIAAVRQADLSVDVQFINYR
ncbi:YajQ family cyclic di-GMP-binding protein [Ectobacillus antri]|jgi:uncharacterized protein YajQ (UPF0234 family)|uniref:Nucleotide-binding protein P6P90_08240 n=1 Tax=Ectobacillus antri TaxID=2486280 RepID=A0ABT6H3M9_9BACI|nr:YajQ family cyclic di-GMP-binding protein [Ectobacillus antri]MDG4656675.1 YajQ family cyclic di-GMP-binding protein [Ectobacillus antri]MDG5753962.1 YajQ family cyclic di-GMP-binding protein [Ectobacillus antri]